MSVPFCSLAVLVLLAPPVETAATPSTRLYIRTLPPDAQVRLDEKLLGKSDGLFVVPPGVRRITIELDGHYPQQRQIEIRSGQVTRLELELQRQPEAEGQPAKADAPPAVTLTKQVDVSKAAAQPGFTIPERALRLGDVDDSAEGKRSFADSGHAIKFQRPAEGKYLTALQLFGSRYGYPQPPAENFHVYLLDKDRKVLRELTYPYSLIERGEERWYTLPVPSIAVPEEFFVAVWFNAEATKGVYVGYDKGVRESHSYVGLPEEGFQPVQEGYDWMVRAYLTPSGSPEADRAYAALPRVAELPAARVSLPEAKIPQDAVRVGHVDNSAEDKRSFGGSGYAVAFDRPQGAKRVVAVQIHGSRYGHPQPPAEDFHVYLLDKDQKILKDLAYPYAMIERGEERWYSLPVPSVEVPEKFYVALSFNAHQTKGVYVGMDRNVKESHSYIGLPDKGFKPVQERYDWMICVYLAPEAVGKEN